MMSESEPSVHLDLVRRVTHEYVLELNGVTSPHTDLEKYAHDALSEARVQEQWDILCRAAHCRLAPDTRVLEVGSGFGAFISYASRLGVSAYGVEVEFSRTQIARDVNAARGTPQAKALCSVGEHLPFADDSFDIVYSINVLEHVRDPERVMAESLRVLKPGGILQFVIPNYGSWWEGHYALIWLPYTPKALGKLYVRLLGRDPAYFDGVHFITPRALRRLLRRYRDQVDILGWGQDVWEERMRALSVMDWAALGKLRRMVQLIHSLKLVNLAISVGCLLNWHTPIILSLRKSVAHADSRDV